MKNLKMMRTLIIVCLLNVLLFSCTSLNTKDISEQPISIIFDTDIGNDVDDVLALDMLYKYMDQGRINLLGIVSSKDDHPYCAEYLDILNTWYGYPDIPIGVLKNGVSREDSIYKDIIKYSKHVCGLMENGKPMFNRTHANYDNTPYSVDLMRKLLANSPDTSVVIITVGFSTNISRLLDSDPDEYSDLSGKALINKKVKYLSMMAGHYKKTENLKEFNVYMDEASARNVFSNWPTPIVSSGFHVGIAIKYPGSSIENDFNYVDHHPMVEAYKAYFPMPYDRPTWDLTAVLYVVEKDSSYFGISPAGVVDVTPEKFIFTENPEGNRTFLTVTDIQAEKIKNHFVDLITQLPKNKNTD